MQRFGHFSNRKISELNFLLIDSFRLSRRVKACHNEFSSVDSSRVKNILSTDKQKSQLTKTFYSQLLV